MPLHFSGQYFHFCVPCPWIKCALNLRSEVALCLNQTDSLGLVDRMVRVTHLFNELVRPINGIQGLGTESPIRQRLFSAMFVSLFIWKKPPTLIPEYLQVSFEPLSEL